MRVVIGLGNPGFEYEETRHNIGFAIVDAVAEEVGITLSEGIGEYIIGEKKIRGESLILVKPLTYMNNSGIAVREVLEEYGIGLGEVLILVDDFHLPLGTLKLRFKGSSGGHNGLYSIIYHLQSDEFPRLRFGIAGESMPREKNRKADFVLSRFDEREIATVEIASRRARDIIIGTVTENLENTIHRFNTVED